jgi:transcriptional regulator with XRE-family HTH domain
MKTLSVEEWEKTVGAQVKELRIRMNLDQRILAERAGVSWSAVKNLEGGKGVTLKTLIRVLRVLDRTEWFETLSPVTTVSPLQMARTKEPRRKVFSSRKKADDV